MKTNSTFKMFRNLLLLVVGLLGFAVSGVGRTINIDVEGGRDAAYVNGLGITSDDDVIINCNWGSASVDFSGVSSCKSLTMKGNGPSVTFPSSFSVSGNFSLENGSFTNSVTLTVGGNLTVSGGTLSGTVSVGGNMTVTGGTLSATSIDVTGNFSTSAGASGTVSVGGDVTATSCALTITTLRLLGTNSHTITNDCPTASEWYGGLTITNLHRCPNVSPTIVQYVNITNNFADLDCGAQISLATISSSTAESGDLFCGNVTLTVSDDGKSPDSGYPTYTWQRSTNGGSTWTTVQSGSSTSYTATAYGQYCVIAAVSADKSATSNTFILNQPNPVITKDKTSLSFSHQYLCSSAAQSVTATYSGACSAQTITANLTGTDRDKFEVSGSNPFSVNLKNNIPQGSYSASLTLSAEGASNVSIPLTGTVTAQTPTLSYSATPFCNGSSTVTVSASNYCAADGYPVYWLYNAGDGLEVHHNTTGSFPGVAKAGSYYAIVYVDETTSFRLNDIVVSSPSITLSTSASLLLFDNETWGDEVTKNITATVTGTYCGDLSVSAVSSNDKFTVGTIVNNGDGTFTIPVTYNETETENSYVGTLTVTAQTNAYSPSLTPATDSKTVSLSGTTTCTPPTIVIEAYSGNSDCTIGETYTCGCNDRWYASYTVNSTSNPYFHVKENGSYLSDVDHNSGKITLSSGISYNSWDKGPMFMKSGASTREYFVVLRKTSSSGYTLDITETEPTCSPTVANVNIPDVCKNAVIDLSGYVPSYTAAGTVTATGWEYSTTEDGSWSSVASPAAFTADKEYYVRYFATDENGTGYSEVSQIRFKTSTIGTLAGFTETAYCTGTTIDLTTDPGAPSYTAADCGTPSVGFEYSSDGTNYTAVADPEDFSLSTAGTYYVRYKVTTNNGTDYSNVSTLTIVGAPSVAEMVIPAAICDEGTLTLTEPNVNSYYIHEDKWEISTDGGSSYSEFDPSSSLSSATYNGALLRYTSTNVCGTSSNTPRTVTVNVPTVDITSATTRKGASYFVQTVATPTTTSSCVNEIVYSIASVVDESMADASSYFTINTETGVVSTTNTVPAGIYTVVLGVRNGSGSVSDTYEVEIEIADRASMNFSCPDAVVTNRCVGDKEITYTLTTSSMRGDKISFALTGTAAKYFSVSPATYTPAANATTQTITVTQSKSLAAGAYNLTLTASANTDSYGTVTASCDAVTVTVSKYDETIGATVTTSGGASSATVYCSEELNLTAASDATDILRYDWYVNGIKQATTSVANASLNFDCSAAPTTIPVKVVMQNESGCLDTAVMNVTLMAYSNTYYYCGNTGDDSDVTNKNNWCTVENGNTATCVHPSDFSHDGCQYIINKDNVKLRSGQTWSVSGAGTKITVGNGWWMNSFSQKFGTSNFYYYDTDKDGNNESIYCEFYGTLSANRATEFYTNVYNADYRQYAKTFTIEGTLSGGATIDVRCGSELEVNTNLGTYTIGECETAYQLAGTSNDGAAGDRYNVMLIPGSIVTYNGDGAKAIQPTTYASMYVNTSGDVAVRDGDVIIMQAFEYDQAPSENFDVLGTNFIFAGGFDQTIPSMDYDKLTVYNSNTKTLAGDIEVKGVMEISSGCKLNAASADIELSGCNTDSVVVIYDGSFDAGTSTVSYTGNCVQKVAALPYYNLNVDAPNTTSEKRVFVPENIIGVGGTFTVDNSLTNTNAYTTAGSTIEFNGTSGQTVPSFTYYNMVVNNSGLTDGGSLTNTSNFLTMTGDVVVQNQLAMTDGVLYTGATPYALTVTGTSSNAVLDGYYTSDTKQSFIQGTLTRYLPSGMSDANDASKYIYPVGDYSLGGYMPLTMQGLTTLAGVPQASVSVQTSTPSTGSVADPLRSVNGSYYWDVDGNDKYGESRITLSTPRGDKTLISAAENTSLFNCVAYNDKSSSWVALNGTTVSPKLIKSYPEGSGYYSFGNRTVEYKTFYYNCESGGDITELSSWSMIPYGSGNHPTSFDLDYATWIIQCDAEITKDFAITGSNTNIVLQGSGLAGSSRTPTLTISGGQTEFVSFKVNSPTIGGHAQPSHVVVGSGADLTVYETLSLGTAESSITNNGTMNVYVEEFSYYDAWVKNNGTMNFRNCDLTIHSNNQQSNAYTIGYESSSTVGHFINNGTVDMTNSGLTVKDRFTQLYNGDGAVWKIDNTTSAIKKTILFDYAEILPVSESQIASPNNAYNYVNLECGSAFYIRNSDVDIEYVGHEGDRARIGGLFVVEDGNMGIGRDGQNGGKVKILECGQVLLYDTDNSGDAIMNVYGVGGTTFDVEGTLYTMGLVASSTNSGSTFTIKDGALVFVGDMGATLPGYSWQYQINVESGGTLNYCGNRSSVADNIGTNNGYLNYAESFYLGTDPIAEGDFKNIYPGDTEALFASIKECMNAYISGTEDISGEFLPVELTMLYGICIDENTVELRWQTASETNNDYFTILRSFDGINFEEIGIVMGAGTTTEFHNYEYYDTDEKEGVVYYKLRQTDFDGNTTESKVIAVQTCGKNAHFKIKQDEIEVFFRNPQANYVVITSVTGQIFYSKKFTNVEEARIAVPQRKGIYIISVIDSKQITSEKFIR